MTALAVGLHRRNAASVHISVPTDDFLDVSVDPLHEGSDDNALYSCEIVAVKPTRHQPAAGKALQEKRANLRLIPGRDM